MIAFLANGFVSLIGASLAVILYGAAVLCGISFNGRNLALSALVGATIGTAFVFYSEWKHSQGDSFIHTLWFLIYGIATALVLCLW